MIKNDLTGKRFDKLTVIEYKGKSKRNQSLWLCKCDCGNERVVAYCNLMSSHSKSCGCSRLGNTNTTHLPPGVSAAKEVYYNYSMSAGKRKLSFSIAFEDFLSMTAKDCFYCGLEPSNNYSGYKSNYIYSGIDRVDNSKGYTLDNCVPCCKICNKMKNDINLNIFIDKIERIYNKLHA